MNEEEQEEKKSLKRRISDNKFAVVSLIIFFVLLFILIIISAWASENSSHEFRWIMFWSLVAFAVLNGIWILIQPNAKESDHVVITLGIMIACIFIIAMIPQSEINEQLRLEEIKTMYFEPVQATAEYNNTFVNVSFIQEGNYTIEITDNFGKEGYFYNIYIDNTSQTLNFTRKSIGYNLIKIVDQDRGHYSEHTLKDREPINIFPIGGD